MTSLLEKIYEMRAEEIAEESQKVLQATQKVYEVMKMWRESVPEENQDQLLELEDMICSAIADNEKIWYQAGLKDGMKLSEEIEKANN